MSIISDFIKNEKCKVNLLFGKLGFIVLKTEIIGKYSEYKTYSSLSW